MKIYFLLAFTRGTPEANPVLVEAIELLKRRGIQVELGIGSEVVLDPSSLKATYDLYVLKSHTSLWLSVAGVLHSQNARLLNPYLSCVATQNKIVSARRLRAARIPAPHTWVTGDLNLLRTVVEERPLFIKPYIGGRGVGAQLIQNARELAELPLPEQPMLIQEYIPGAELKVYVIGEEVFAMRKLSTATSTTRLLCPVSPELRAIALRCGQIFGLGLYGLDVIESPERPVVIDLNYFPSYKGVPNAADHLADYIEGYATGKLPELVPGKADNVAAAPTDSASVWAMRWP
ncbi:MAG: hypothetical protein PVSMB4_09240 [Ktedonobacterales bacterium]